MEIIEGYVVDLACIRKYPQAEIIVRARSHTKNCALMGHCVESGYGLVGEDGRISVLDSEATPRVVEALVRSSAETGIKLRVVRERTGEEMMTSRIEVVVRR